MTQIEYEDLLKLLAETPGKGQHLIDGLSESDARWKPSAAKFSVLENACHLRDIETDGYAIRINKILNEDEPFLADLDGAKLAADREYNSQELSSALDAFSQAREANLRTIESLSQEQLDRSGNFENTGAIRLSKLLSLMREHDEAHLNELKNLLRKLTRNV